ncbi:MAG: tetratricopeptide repeat protein [Spirochaetaceae bacterium]|jgi:Tfp pilus assembly protein PilF|nr:tetratricopeptide repeat protein [Spirochaetaceae bacterium]
MKKWGLLPFVCAAGLVFSVIISAALLFLAVMGLSPDGTESKAQKETDPFYRALIEFDTGPGAAQSRPDRLDALLSELEKKALGVDSRLSVLKRRRILARQYPEFTEQYRDAALRAQEDFPYSEPLALAAAESLLLESEARGTQDDEALKTRLGALAGTLPADSHALAVLALRVLAGECADIRSAAAIPDAERLFDIAAAETGGTERGLLTVNSVLLRIRGGNIPGAMARLEALLNAGDNSEETLKTTAALIYDYGDPLRAAALLAPFTDPESIAKEADALYLGGSVDGAKNLWKLLLSPGDDVPLRIRERALYNLGVLETDTRAARSYLEELLMLNPGSVNGIMRYSRLLPAPEAIALLEGIASIQDGDAEFPLRLETLKRKRDLVQPARLAAETWLLINAYPQEPAAYEWGAFYFDLQRLYDETAILFRNAGFNNIESPPLSLHKALLLILNGSMESGEEQLLGLAKASPDWRIYANLGRVREARRGPQEALSYYEAALSAASGPGTAERARLELRTARINLALGKNQEARKALERAGEIDPDNLSVQVEIHHLRNILGY